MSRIDFQSTSKRYSTLFDPSLHPQSQKWFFEDRFYEAAFHRGRRWDCPNFDAWCSQVRSLCRASAWQFTGKIHFESLIVMWCQVLEVWNSNNISMLFCFHSSPVTTSTLSTPRCMHQWLSFKFGVFVGHESEEVGWSWRFSRQWWLHHRGVLAHRRGLAEWRGGVEKFNQNTDCLVVLVDDKWCI